VARATARAGPPSPLWGEGQSEGKQSLPFAATISFLTKISPKFNTPKKLLPKINKNVTIL